MTQRKIALVGTTFGPWISVRRMSPLSIKVDMPAETEVSVLVTPEHQAVSTAEVFRFDSAGEHPICDGAWAHIYVSKGDPSAVLCTLYSRQG